MRKEKARSVSETNQETPQPAGDNRRAGDTDGNASDGSTKSKGATNPPDQPSEKGKE